MDIDLDLSDPASNLLYRALSVDETLLKLEGSERKAVDISPSGSGMEFREFLLEGFGPHKGPNQIRFDGNLVLVEGPNGTGKSHILHGAYWIFFGKTGEIDPWSKEEVKPEDLVNWNDLEAGFSAEMKLKIAEEIFSLRRSYREGSNGSKFLKLSDGKWIGREPMEMMDPVLAPFLIFQGENSMLLSSRDPFSEKGILFRVIRSISGANELEHAGSILESERIILMDNLRGKGKIIDDLGILKKKYISEMEKISNDIETSRKRILELAEESRKAREDYSLIVGNLSKGSKKGSDPEMDAATRAGRIQERLSNAWSGAYVALLRKRSESALKKAISTREESTRKRILFGVHEAQEAIVEEILNRKTCICGSSIGTTGMGRERLKHLLDTIGGRKEDVSDWETGCLWCSDAFIGTASIELSSPKAGREEIVDMLKNLQRVNRETMKASFGDEERSELVEAVRRHERNTILLREERKKKKILEREYDDFSKQIDTLDVKLRKISLEEGDLNSEEVLKSIEKAMKLSDTLCSEVIEKTRKWIEGEATSILREITSDSELRVRIHDEEMTMGRERSGMGKVIHPTRLSAGEREVLLLSIVIAISRFIRSGLILDSPFTGVESKSIRKCMELLAGENRSILVLAPLGTVPDENIPISRYNLVPTSEGSMIEEV
jgi:hypothetical protein